MRNALRYTRRKLRQLKVLYKNSLRYVTKLFTDASRVNKILVTGLIVMLLFWSGYGINAAWNSNYTHLLSENGAQLAQASALIANLPKISAITPAQTSGNAAGIVEAYSSASSTLAETPIKRNNPFTTGRLVNKQLASLHDKSTSALKKASTDLKDIAELLESSRRFIEYAPAVDLASYSNGSEKDATERLTRTQDAIASLRKDLQYKSFPDKQSILSSLDKLAGAATAVTPKTVPEWSSDVKLVQVSLLKSIEKLYDSSAPQDAIALNNLSKQYIAIK